MNKAIPVFQYISLLFCLFLLSPSLAAQQDYYGWRAGLHGGVMHYYGDLSDSWFDTNSRLNDLSGNLDYFSYGVSVEKQLSGALGLRALWSAGEFIANDRQMNRKGELQTDASNFRRSLNVRTEISDVSLLLTYYFDNDKLLGKRAKIAPFLSAGIGWTDFKTFGDLYLADGQRYFYWSDNTIRTVAESSGQGGRIIEQDGIFETALAPLHTEGVNYSSELVHLTAGLGLKFRLNNRFNLNLETLLHYTNSDYLDDVSGRFPQGYDSEQQAYASNPAGIDQPSRGNPDQNNDLFAFTSLSIHYNFGRKPQAFKAPVIRTGHSFPADPPSKSGRHEKDNLLSSSLDSLAQPGVDSLGNLADALPKDSLSQLLRDRVVLQEGAGMIDSLKKELAYPEADTTAAKPSSVFPEGVRDSLLMPENEKYVPVSSGKKDSLIRIVEKRVEIVEKEKDVAEQKKLTAKEKVRPDTVIRIVETSAGTKAGIDSESKEWEQLMDRLERLESSIQQMRTPTARTSDLDAPKADAFQEDDIGQERISPGFQEAQVLLLERLARSLAILEKNQTERETSLRQPVGKDTVFLTTPDSLLKENEYLRLEVAQLINRMDSLSRSSRRDTIYLTLPAGKPKNEKEEEDLQKLLELRNSKDMEIRKQAREIRQLQEQIGQQEQQLALFRGELRKEQQEKARPDKPSLLKQKIEEKNPQKVFFALGSATLDLSARQSLEEVVVLLKLHDRLSARISGFTDTSGNPSFNEKLALRRAQAVADYIIRQGVAGSRFSVSAAGEDPQASAAYGRRVEVWLQLEEK
jgi:outer membrane protein OmpA-like peptidoglycan-associated protein